MYVINVNMPQGKYSVTFPLIKIKLLQAEGTVRHRGRGSCRLLGRDLQEIILQLLF
jgi:hypothetical protein